MMTDDFFLIYLVKQIEIEWETHLRRYGDEHIPREKHAQSIEKENDVDKETNVSRGHSHTNLNILQWINPVICSVTKFSHNPSLENPHFELTFSFKRERKEQEKDRKRSKSWTSKIKKSDSHFQ